MSNGSKSVAIFNRLPWLCAHLTEVGGWAIGKKPTTPANYRQVREIEDIIFVVACTAIAIRLEVVGLLVVA